MPYLGNDTSSTDYTWTITASSTTNISVSASNYYTTTYTMPVFNFNYDELAHITGIPKDFLKGKAKKKDIQLEFEF